ncbi:phage tail protein [Escherichia coli]|nr:phage tail protein [Escherichia coli]
MTAKYFAILTNQGAARLANAAALGTKLNMTQMAVGDANGVLPTPDPAQTKLINQKRIAPLNLLTVDPANTSQIIAEQIIPENEGGFWIREIGLYDDDGILIAVANCPETYKPELQEGSGRTQTIRMILIVSSTSAITLKIDPSVVLATRQYVDDKVIEVKSYADGLMRAHEQSRNHPDATTTAKGFTQLNSSVTDDRETQSATPKAVKIAMDNANARLAKERNLSDLPNPALARQNLQLGDSSTKNTGTTANTVAAGDDARITGAMQKSQNGADIQDVAKFLQNLGLGEAAKRGVGTGDNQIPDMGAFASGSGWFRLPGGYIVQFGTFAGNTTRFISGHFPIPFPNQPMVSVSVMSDAVQSDPSIPAPQVLSVNFEHISNSAWRVATSDISQQYRFSYISIGR